MDRSLQAVPCTHGAGPAVADPPMEVLAPSIRKPRHRGGDFESGRNKATVAELHHENSLALA